MKTLLIIAICIPLRAADVTIAWDANDDPPPQGAMRTEGYRLYWGIQHGVYPLSQDAGLTTTNTVTGLTNGVPYYFVVKAYGAGNIESGPSAVVTYTPPLLPPQVPGGLRVVGLTTHMTIQWEPVGEPSVAAVVDPKLLTLDFSLSEVLDR